MSSIHDEYSSYKKNLRDEDKKNLKEEFQEKREKRENIIEKNVSDNKRHLKLVNGCCNAFYYKSKLNKETDYIFLTFEPLYGENLKNFDVAVFGNGNLILVECKSSISKRKVGEVLDDFEEKVKTVERNLDLLKNKLNVDVNSIEHVLCSFAPVFPRASIISKLKERDFQPCLWAMDKQGDSLWLKEFSDDTNEEIKKGRTHKDKKLRTKLRNTVKLGRSPRTAPFLPSSHSCIILSSISAYLHTNMKREGRESFSFDDVHATIDGLRPFKNFSPKQISVLTENVIDVGLETDIFQDQDPSLSEMRKKRFSLTCPYSKVEEEYINKSAEKWAKKKALEELKKERKTLEDYP